jgi:hypothetical protein
MLDKVVGRRKRDTRAEAPDGRRSSWESRTFALGVRLARRCHKRLVFRTGRAGSSARYGFVHIRTSHRDLQFGGWSEGKGERATEGDGGGRGERWSSRAYAHSYGNGPLCSRVESELRRLRRGGGLLSTAPFLLFPFPLQQSHHNMTQSSPYLFRVAAVQAEPVWLDVDAGVEKTIRILKVAAANRAELVGFPVSLSAFSTSSRS